MLAKLRNKETGQVDELIITIRSDLGTPALFNFNPDREIQSMVDSDRSGFSIYNQGVFKVWPIPRAPIEELKIRYVSLIAYEVSFIQQYQDHLARLGLLAITPYINEFYQFIWSVGELYPSIKDQVIHMAIVVQNIMYKMIEKQYHDKNKTWFTKGDDYSIYELDPFKTDPGNTDPRGLEFTQAFFKYDESLIAETVERMLKQACPDLIAKAVHSKEDYDNVSF